MANTKVTQELIADDAIGAAQLASNAVVTASIADDAVTSAKLDTNLSVAGSLTAVGTLTANAGINVDNINIDGTTIGLSTGDLTLDVAGDIILDADGGDIRFIDAGTAVAVFENDSLNFKIVNSTQDKDIIFRGNDGGSGIDALTLDMSDAGTAIFNAGASFGGDISHTASSNFDIKNTIASQNITFHTRASGGSTAEKMRITHDGMVFIENDAGKFKAGASGDLEMYHDGSNSYIADVGTGELILKGTVAAETSAYIKQVAITSSSNAVAWNSAAAANAYHVTTENTTFSAPSNAVEGAIISVELAQGGTVRTIAWNTVFEFAASTAPTVTATANKTDIFSFRYNGSVWQEIGRVQNLAQT